MKKKKRIQNSRLKKRSFSKSQILKIFLRIYMLQILFIFFLLDQKQGELSNESAAPSIDSYRTRLKKPSKQQNKQNLEKTNSRKDLINDS